VPDRNGRLKGGTLYFNEPTGGAVVGVLAAGFAARPD
jgi:hypothetical protein